MALQNTLGNSDFGYLDGRECLLNTEWRGALDFLAKYSCCLPHKKLIAPRGAARRAAAA
jgi:hypothetical protein